jgi:hypothetical protein
VKHRAILVVGTALLLAAVGGVAGWRWWHDRPPYDPEILAAQATLQLVDQATANADLAPSIAVISEDGDQIFLGRVAWTVPPRTTAGSTLRIVLLDKRSHLTPGVIAVKSDRQDEVSTGWDGSLDTAAERYPWLNGFDTRQPDGSYGGASTFITSSLDASPVTFQTVLHPARLQTALSSAVATAPAAVSDFMIVLISVGSDGQVYWAHRLLN